MPTPRETLDRLLRGISAGASPDLADLYADDAVVDLPFAIPAPVGSATAGSRRPATTTTTRRSPRRSAA
jgi:hypothetical protein